jgi:3-hydroxyacyl-[acyl-carrier-protein] dehydratase
LFVDEIVSLVPRVSVHARRTFRADEPFFAGHYPGAPITPGVLLCEAIFQAGALLVAASMPDLAGRVPVLTRVRQAKFRRPVLPGETVELEVALTDQLASAYVFHGTARVAQEQAVAIDYACALVPAPGSTAADR